jgi:hypothetical protein
MVGRFLLLLLISMVAVAAPGLAQRQLTITNLKQPTASLQVFYLDTTYHLRLRVAGIDEEQLDYNFEGAEYRPVGNPGDYELEAASELVRITAYHLGRKVAVAEVPVQEPYTVAGTEQVDELPEQVASLGHVFSIGAIDSLYTHLLATKMNLKPSDIQVKLYDLVLARGKTPVNTFIIDLGQPARPSLEPFREDAKPGDRLLIEAMEVHVKLESGGHETISYAAYLVVNLK